MWWLELAGVAGFAVVLVTAFVIWRQQGTAYGRPATVGALFVVGLVVFVAGVVTLILTA